MFILGDIFFKVELPFKCDMFNFMSKINKVYPIVSEWLNK